MIWTIYNHVIVVICHDNVKKIASAGIRRYRPNMGRNDMPIPVSGSFV